MTTAGLTVQFMVIVDAFPFYREVANNFSDNTC